MSKRYAIGKPVHPWKHMPKWATADSERLILSLTKLEAEIRTEIAQDETQTWLMPNGLMARRLRAKKPLPPLMGGS